MEEIAIVTMDNLSPVARRQLGRYRRAVFVEHMKWDLPSAGKPGTEEWDEFDRNDTTHVIGYTETRQICGYTRLLPTTRPYLLAEVFPDLMSEPLAGDPRIWEMSRFTTLHDNVAIDLQRMRQLLRIVFQYAICLEIQRLIGVAPVSMTRLYRRLGLELRAMGPVAPARGDRLAAFSLDVDRAGLTLLCDRSA
ncbi:acyl-homoserine-lactone synthase [Paraburkholderia bryophila]|uniref:Acyl-homoserine-lactone synthase n=1 Tax=Paraburkholderia bryophila TaxID=420952 RepID=A0A7Y9WBY8_9BURK|nr:acyl-homoserine-lactone synthase [Paraburkholderia bryophila]NYH17183.1 acyl homoserine lactone synthase [Paraburkholderia bryophila]NYH27530.1 acyl homoserine lactone synthase [Paraburkholderia bryophila]